MEDPVTDGDDYAVHRQLAVVDDDVVTPISHSISNSDSSSTFSLPDGWAVRKVLRSDGLRFDKYYIEPETGRKFRSRREVKRYFNVEEYKATRSRPLRLEYCSKDPRDQMMITSVANITPKSKRGSSRFALPKGWFVEEVLRKSGGTSDKYYHDPESGQKFRSMKEVERYLIEGLTPTRSRAKRLNYHDKHLQNCDSRKKIVSSGKMLDFEEEDKYNQYQLVNASPTISPSTSTFKLPDGWTVEEVPRKTGSHTDRYYYEPGTQQKFRSLTAVQNHLAELEENSPLSVVLEEHRENNLPLSKAFKLRSSIKNHGSYDSWKKSISRKEEASLFSSPPSKIKWVIGSSGGDTWNAFIGDTIVPDSVKQKWGTEFISGINNNEHNPSIST